MNIAPVAPLAAVRMPAVSVHECGGGDVTPRDLAESYGRSLLARVESYAQTGFAAIRLDWLRHCAHIDGQVRVSTGAEVIEGYFADLDTDGALVLRDDAGQDRRVTTGDVELMGRP